MKNILIVLTFFLSSAVNGLEYEKQFENENLILSKVKIQPYEEIGLHRDAYKQVVIALKGGIIKRIEKNGREVDVHFPTGIAVIREPDPVNELHRTINNSSEPVELIILHLKE